MADKLVDKRKAQVSLEVALSIACILLLLLGTLNVFIWVNERLVVRQEDYESSRQAAGDGNPGVQVDESGYSKLNIFKK